uniref:Serine/threonine-protein phosphatase n=1 Tax=Strongyloides stercoralis TaxID=6248 RepID=A0A0K0ELK0_STRER
MRGGKIVKEKLKKKKHSGDSRDLSSARIDAPSNNNGKLKLKKRRHSSNLLRKIVESLNLSKQKSTNLKDVNDLNSESCSSSLSLKPEDDKSKTQSFSLNDNSTSRNNTLFEKNTSGIVKLNNDKKGPVTSEMYLTGNDSGYQKQMKKYINKLGQCKGQNLSPNKFLVILMKLFSIIEKHFNLGNTFDIDYAFSKFFTIERIQSILHKAATIFKGEPILLNLSATKQDIVVISDIHGSILDLIKVLSDNGLPESKTYLFLGNYVDKGTDDIAVVTLLLLLKICFPNNVYLLRGNHEFLDQNSKQCFPIRCKNYFGSYNTYRMFNYCFEFLPLAAIIDDDILCVHGGVSQWIRNRNSISSLIRPLNINKDIISRMIITDLVWADSSRGEYEFSDRSGFTLSKRGIGYAFNEYGLKNILEKLNVTRIIRGHQPCEEGYKIEYDHLCYTIHLRNLFEYYNSYGSYCIVKNTHNDELTVKSIINLPLTYYIDMTSLKSAYVPFIEEGDEADAMLPLMISAIFINEMDSERFFSLKALRNWKDDEEGLSKKFSKAIDVESLGCVEPEDIELNKYYLHYNTYTKRFTRVKVIDNLIDDKKSHNRLIVYSCDSSRVDDVDYEDIYYIPEYLNDIIDYPLHLYCQLPSPKCLELLNLPNSLDYDNLTVVKAIILENSNIPTAIILEGGPSDIQFDIRHMFDKLDENVQKSWKAFVDAMTTGEIRQILCKMSDSNTFKISPNDDVYIIDVDDFDAVHIRSTSMSIVECFYTSYLKEYFEIENFRVRQEVPKNEICLGCIYIAYVDFLKKFTRIRIITLDPHKEYITFDVVDYPGIVVRSVRTSEFKIYYLVQGLDIPPLYQTVKISSSEGRKPSDKDVLMNIASKGGRYTLKVNENNGIATLYNNMPNNEGDLMEKVMKKIDEDCMMVCQSDNNELITKSCRLKAPVQVKRCSFNQSMSSFKGRLRLRCVESSKNVM